MINVCGVKFSLKGRIYYFKKNKLDLKIKDNVIVETERGEKFGIVVKDNSIEIPVKLLSAGAKVSVVLSEPDSQGTEINDITVKNVQRKGKKEERKEKEGPLRKASRDF